MFDYAVLFLNREVEFHTTEPPERFVELVAKFYEVFGMELPEYEVWQNVGTWTPLFGVDEDVSQLVLFPGVLGEQVKHNNNTEVMGQWIVRNYRRWLAEMRVIRNKTSRESDRTRSEILKQKIYRVQLLVAMLQEGGLYDVDVAQVFAWMTKGNSSYRSVAQSMNVSRATLFRYKQRLMRELGDYAIRKFGGNELEQILND